MTNFPTQDQPGPWGDQLVAAITERIAVPQAAAEAAQSTADGKPSLTSSAASASAVGDSASAGVATTAARADHVHGRESFGSVTAQTSYGASSGNGSASTVARSDHTHGTPALPSAADIGAAASSHAHSGSDVTSGTVAYARLPVGTASSTVAAGDDSRITGALQKSGGTMTGQLVAGDVEVHGYHYADGTTELNGPVLLDQGATAYGAVVAAAGLEHDGTLGLFGATPTTKPTVTGSTGGNAALESLLEALAGLGLITDSSE